MKVSLFEIGYKKKWTFSPYSAISPCSPRPVAHWSWAGLSWSVPGWETPVKTRLLLEEVLVRPAGGAHPVVCVGPNAPE